MTVDEAIKHTEDIAEEKEKLANRYESFKDYGDPRSSITSGHEKLLKSAKEHSQLAEWLRELKEYRKQKNILDKIKEEVKLLSNANPSYWHSGDMVDREEVFEIIDKYRESEE